MSADLFAIRSMLFLPASNPRAIAKARDSAADLVVLVLPAELRAVTSAEAVAAEISSRNANVGLVVRGPAPGGLRAADIAAALDLSLLTTMRAEPGLAERLERGGHGGGPERDRPTGGHRDRDPPGT